MIRVAQASHHESHLPQDLAVVNHQVIAQLGVLQDELFQNIGGEGQHMHVHHAGDADHRFVFIVDTVHPDQSVLLHKVDDLLVAVTGRDVDFGQSIQNIVKPAVGVALRAEVLPFGDHHGSGTDAFKQRAVFAQRALYKKVNTVHNSHSLNL